MTRSDTQQITEVIHRVQGWPVPMRIVLARRILETLEIPPAGSTPRGPSAAEIAAMFPAGKPAPNDEETQTILEEELMRKYGT